MTHERTGPPIHHERTGPPSLKNGPTERRLKKRDPWLVHFGTAVRKLRERARLTQPELGAKLGPARGQGPKDTTGVTAIVVSRIESGIHDPPFTRVVALTEALGVSMQELMLEAARAEILAGKSPASRSSR